MKKIILIPVFFILCNLIYAQKFDIVNINNIAQDSISYIRDIHFVNENVGFVTAVKYRYHNGQYYRNVYYVFSTTDGGTNWNKKWSGVYDISSNQPAIFMLNASTGYYNLNAQTYKTTNGGNNWTAISQGALSSGDFDRVMAFSNTDVGYLIDRGISYGRIYKMTSVNQGFQILSSNDGVTFTNLALSKVNTDYIYFCGYKNNSGQYYPYLVRTTNAGQNWDPILSGNSDPYDVGRLFNVSVINRNGIDVVKISASRGMLEYANGNITKLCTWDSDRLISFGDYNYGYSMKYDGGGTEDPEMYLDVTAVQEIYKTNDGGVTWISDNTGNNPSEYFRTSKKFYSNGEITYYTKSGTGLTAQFIARKLYNNFRYNFDNISSSGSFSINNQTKNTPLDQYFRGGIYPVWTEAILNSGQTNERIFYRWNNGRMLSSYNNFDNYYEGIVGPYYKTKQIADNQWAINNPTQTKSVRDTSIVSGGIIHQVHESIGGIFYTRSTDGGATFEREEIAKLKS